MKAGAILVLLLCGIVATKDAEGFPAAAVVTEVSWERVKIGGKRYYEVEATLRGEGAGGPYRVPVTLLYPVERRACNGVGIVDLLNNSAMLLMAAEGVTQAPLAAGRARLTDEFLGREGYFYASVQWERSRGAADVIGLFNQLFGTRYVIPSNADSFAIILDAAMLVKAPPPGLPGEPCAVGKAAIYGMSASTTPINLLKQPALSSPELASAFAARYDGVILDSITSGFSPFPVAKTGVKTIAVSAETDVQLFRNDVNVRGEGPEYRAYEVAGGTHVSWDQHDLVELAGRLPTPPALVVRQNLATHSPFLRAVMEHLRRWMTVGTPPPPSVSFDGAGYGLLPLSCTGLPIPGMADLPRDGAGNVLGGVRLPFMSVPLGRYDGVELQYGCSAGGFPQMALVTGTFLRDDAMLARFRNHGAYVARVAAAAQLAYERGWLLREDGDAYLRTAARCAVGRAPAASLTLEELAECHGR